MQNLNKDNMFIKQENISQNRQIKNELKRQNNLEEIQIDDLKFDSEEVILKETEGIKYFQFKKLLEYKNLVHAYPLGLNLNFRTGRKQENFNMRHKVTA